MRGFWYFATFPYSSMPQRISTIAPLHSVLHLPPDSSCCPRGPHKISFPRFILLSFESEWTPHDFCLPAFDSNQARSAPRPAFTPKNRVRCTLIPVFFCTLSSTAHLCSCRSSSVSPPRFVGTLHPLFQTFLLLSRGIEIVSQDFEKQVFPHCTSTHITDMTPNLCLTQSCV